MVNVNFVPVNSNKQNLIKIKTQIESNADITIKVPKLNRNTRP